MSQEANLVWFRNDLRVADNPALYHAALDQKKLTIATFVLTPAQWREHDLGTPKVTLLWQCLKVLASELEQLNIPLFVLECGRFSKVPETLLRLIKEQSVTQVFWNHEYELNEQRRDHQVSNFLANSGVAFTTFHDQTVIPPDHPDLKTGTGNSYSVFTPFKKKWLDIVAKEQLINCLNRPAKQPSRLLVGNTIPEFESIWGAKAFAHTLPTDLAGIKDQLRSFIDEPIYKYNIDRDIPSLLGTSKLSPYLACGAISPRQCIQSVLKRHPQSLALPTKSGPQVWISELIWRDFYRYVTFHNPHICKHRPFQAYTDKILWRDSPEDFDAWCTGRTGYPIVDAGMRELNQTGWMHNRVRMITAMFLSKHLLIDWRLGERFFMQKLVDADFCSNNGGWQWSASTGTDAAPYFRIFNPSNQSERYDSLATYIKKFCPELNGVTNQQIHDPQKMAGRPLAYPSPIVEHSFARDRALRAFSAAKESF